jgi:hypothetical protein
MKLFVRFYLLVSIKRFITMLGGYKKTFVYHLGIPIWTPLGINSLGDTFSDALISSTHTSENWWNDIAFQMLKFRGIIFFGLNLVLRVWLGPSFRVFCLVFCHLLLCCFLLLFHCLLSLLLLFHCHLLSLCFFKY